MPPTYLTKYKQQIPINLRLITGSTILRGPESTNQFGSKTYAELSLQDHDQGYFGVRYLHFFTCQEKN